MKWIYVEEKFINLSLIVDIAFWEIEKAGPTWNIQFWSPTEKVGDCFYYTEENMKEDWRKITNFLNSDEKFLWLNSPSVRDIPSSYSLLK